MAFDQDWMKVMGEGFIPLNAGQVIDASTEETPAPAEVDPVKDEVPVEPVVEDEVVPEEPIPTDESQAADMSGEPSEEMPGEPAEEEATDEAYLAAEKLIDELLGQVEETSKAKDEQGEKLEEAVKKTGDEDLKRELEQYKLKEEQMETKVAALTTEYKKLLDRANTLEAINDEHTAKMKIVSDNPLMQDLLRGLYLQGRDPSAVTSIENVLKDMMKEYAQIDVDDLVSRTRDSSAEGLSPSQASAVVGENTVYKGLLDEGDIVPLGAGE